MANTYICPHCKGYLNVEDHIVFIAKNKANNRGILFLSQEVGNYRVIKNDNCNFQEGEELDFYCPMCQASLEASNINEKLAKIIMIEDGTEYELFFSEIKGEHSTYKISDNIFEAYGEDSDKYVNFFGECPKY